MKRCLQISKEGVLVDSDTGSIYVLDPEKTGYACIPANSREYLATFCKVAQSGRPEWKKESKMECEVHGYAEIEYVRARFPGHCHPGGALQYKTGDVMDALEGDRRVILAHCCNDIGAWGAGFTACIDKRWPEVGKAFRKAKPNLGEVQFCRVSENITVANIVGQHGVRYLGNPKPIRWAALHSGLQTTARWALLEFGELVPIVAPMMGTGLAGGTVAELKHTLNSVAKLTPGFNITIYQLEQDKR